VPKRNDIEHIEQAAFIQWCRMQTTADRYPGIEMAFAIPNGGKRGIAVAVKMKAEGTLRGVPDLFIPVPICNYHGAFIEMKAPGGSTSKEQNEFIAFLQDKCYFVRVCYGFVQAMKAVDDYYCDPGVTKLFESERE